MTVIETAQTARKYPAVYTAIKDLLYQAADDDLVIGHRASEWLGLAPEIEEDVAFSSISQDEVGHAQFYYGLLAELGEHAADILAFERPAESRRNAVLLERPNGDWAHTIVRHYFYDLFEDLRLAAMEQSAYLPLQQGAVKIRREEFYHKMHHDLWFTRLMRAGGEARDRMEAAVQQLWPDVPSLFDLGPHEDVLVTSGILPVMSKDLQQAWLDRMTEVFASVNYQAPRDWNSVTGRHHHTVDLDSLLRTMGEVYFIDQRAAW